MFESYCTGFSAREDATRLLASVTPVSNSSIDLLLLFRYFTCPINHTSADGNKKINKTRIPSLRRPLYQSHAFAVAHGDEVLHDPAFSRLVSF